MGKFLQGILGGVSGLVGTVVGASVHGVPTVRIRPKKSTKAPSQAQINQRNIFSAVTNFVFTALDIVQVGYQYYNGSRLSAANAAVQYHLKNAITGVSPNRKIDYSKVKLSKDIGGLETYSDVAVENAAGVNLNLTWDPAEGYSEAQQLIRNQDKGIFYLYDETSGYSFINNEDITRGDGKFKIHLSRIFIGGKTHSWFFFASADGKVSRTQYLGAIVPLA